MDITYTPVADETDTGTLTFNYGDGTVEVPLTGTGVATLSYATKTKLVGPHGTIDLGSGLIQIEFIATVTSKGIDLLDGSNNGFPILKFAKVLKLFNRLWLQNSLAVMSFS